MECRIVKKNRVAGPRMGGREDGKNLENRDKDQGVYAEVMGGGAIAADPKQKRIIFKTTNFLTSTGYKGWLAGNQGREVSKKKIQNKKTLG